MSLNQIFISVSLFHHISFDGWSFPIFESEFKSFYDYFDNQSKSIESKIDLKPLDIQYKDFSVWQRQYLSGDRLNQLIDYWKSKLDDFETLNLMIDYPSRPANFDYTGNDLIFEIDEPTTKSLKDVAKNLKSQCIQSFIRVIFIVASKLL